MIVTPILAISGVAVAITSRGPILFRQKRVGQHGCHFTLYKLRTMKVANNGPQVTALSDNRITAVGKFLRKTKLDELPELWNIVKGDMSFVGPRPEVERYVDFERNPMWRFILKARPGITDPVTLRLRNEENLMANVVEDHERFYMDKLQPFKLAGYLEYLQKRSWRTDLVVLLHTVIAVLFPTKTASPTIEEILMYSTANIEPRGGHEESLTQEK